MTAGPVLSVTGLKKHFPVHRGVLSRVHTDEARP